MKTKLKNQKGFTIIEVLIVLAIAGLILLIVFLAVPALQRNSRNTQRKNNVAALLGGISEFSNNNNGRSPNGTWTIAGSTVTLIGLATDTTAEVVNGFYNEGVNAATNGFVNKQPAGTATAAGTLVSRTTDYVVISTGTECIGGAGASQAGPPRSVTAVYEIERGAGTYAQVCQQS